MWGWLERIPRHLRISAALVPAAFLGLRVFLPCGCFGMTFWRPSVLAVDQIPEVCAVLDTPSKWIAVDGSEFDPDWEYRGWASRGEPRFVYYEVRRGQQGLLVGMSVPASETVRTRNAFRVEGGRLVAATASEWSGAELLPTASFTGAWPGQWQAVESLTGPAFAGTIGMPSPDEMSPWIIRRTRLIRFQNITTQKYLGPPLEHSFCGRERWMMTPTSWHGLNILTVPLSLDGRSFVLCELK